MKKVEVIKQKEEFNNIIKTCSYYKNKYFTIYIRKRDFNISKFGIAISKKVGNAVTRNKQKRRLRVIIDLNKDIFSKSNDYIIMIKKDCVSANFHDLEKKLIQLIKETK